MQSAATAYTTSNYTTVPTSDIESSHLEIKSDTAATDDKTSKQRSLAARLKNWVVKHPLKAVGVTIGLAMLGGGIYGAHLGFAAGTVAISAMNITLPGNTTDFTFNNTREMSTPPRNNTRWSTPAPTRNARNARNATRGMSTPAPARNATREMSTPASNVTRGTPTQHNNATITYNG